MLYIPLSSLLINEELLKFRLSRTSFNSWAIRPYSIFFSLSFLRWYDTGFNFLINAKPKLEVWMFDFKVLSEVIVYGT
jgi:hypothetical protein